MRLHSKTLAVTPKPRWAVLLVLAGCLCAAVLFPGPAVAGDSAPELAAKTVAVPAGVAYIPDVTYVTFADQTTLELDIAYPSRGAGPFPVLLILHGQGWVMGNRKIMTPYLLTAAQAGYVAVAISYRFAPQHPFPAAVQDGKCAVRWLRANAAKYNLDKDRIGAFGFSAGGNLACMLGTTDSKAFEDSGGHPDQSDRVQAVASFYGITDLAELDRSRAQMPWLEDKMIAYSLTSYLGGGRDKVAERYAQASPMTHVTKAAPPTFLAHGTKDRLVPIEQSRLYAALLKKNGTEVSLFEAFGAGHDFIGDPEKEALQAMFAFLDKRLKRAEVLVVGPRTKE